MFNKKKIYIMYHHWPG